MNGLSDSFTIAILLVLVFGAVAFYLYSRLSQSEKRLSLMENLLLTLKLNTEASLAGPEPIEPVSSSEEEEEAEGGDLETYADILKEIPTPTQPEKPATPPPAVEEEAEEEELLRAAASVPLPVVDVNYESLTAKELRSLAKERGLTGIPQSKREIIDLLKRNGNKSSTSSIPLSPTPLAPSEGELDGSDHGQQGFTLDLESS